MHVAYLNKDNLVGRMTVILLFLVHLARCMPENTVLAPEGGQLFYGVIHLASLIAGRQNCLSE